MKNRKYVMMTREENEKLEKFIHKHGMTYIMLEKHFGLQTTMLGKRWLKPILTVEKKNELMAFVDAEDPKKIQSIIASQTFHKNHSNYNKKGKRMLVTEEMYEFIKDYIEKKKGCGLAKDLDVSISQVSRLKNRETCCISYNMYKKIESLMEKEKAVKEGKEASSKEEEKKEAPLEETQKKEKPAEEALKKMGLSKTHDHNVVRLSVWEPVSFEEALGIFMNRAQSGADEKALKGMIKAMADKFCRAQLKI